MTDTRYPVHGVFWGGAPAQAVGHDGGSPARLPPGRPRPGRAAQQVRSAAKAEAFAGPLTAAAGLCAPTPRHAYPHPLEQVKHGFGITALSGTNALASLSGTDAAFVVNLGRPAARAIVLGDFASEVPAVQESLF